MPRNSEQQKVCYRAECKETWRKKTLQSRFIGTGTVPVGSPLGNPIKSGVQEAVKSDQAWFVVAGGWKDFHTPVPDGPGNQWKDGQYERIEARNRAALKAAGL
jgi:hypothetical protein